MVTHFISRRGLLLTTVAIASRIHAKTVTTMEALTNVTYKGPVVPAQLSKDALFSLMLGALLLTGNMRATLRIAETNHIVPQI